MSHEAMFIVKSEAEMDAFGANLARQLRTGDTLLLSGVIGAGKTHLCRSIIRSILGRQEDVPSPTYTLVQTYEGDDAEIWHADLYRLGDSSELIELGLDDAIDTAIVLIEWPDRLPEALMPVNPLCIKITTDGEARRVELSTRSDRMGRFLGTLWDG